MTSLWHNLTHEHTEFTKPGVAIINICRSKRTGLNDIRVALPPPHGPVYLIKGWTPAELARFAPLETAEGLAAWLSSLGYMPKELAGDDCA